MTFGFGQVRIVGSREVGHAGMPCVLHDRFLEDVMEAFRCSKQPRRQRLLASVSEAFVLPGDRSSRDTVVGMSRPNGVIRGVPGHDLAISCDVDASP